MATVRSRELLAVLALQDLNIAGLYMRSLFSLVEQSEHHVIYCKFRNFRENFIFVNRVKRHFRDVKYLLLGDDLHISVKDSEISLFREGFIFTQYAKFRKNKTLIKISESTVLVDGRRWPKMTWKKLTEKHCHEWKLKTINPQEGNT